MKAIKKIMKRLGIFAFFLLCSPFACIASVACAFAALFGGYDGD